MSTNGFRKVVLVSVLSGAMIASGCSPIVRNHGYLPVSAEVAAITIGNDSKDTVYSRLGEPTSKGVEGDNAWYYVSYTVQKRGFMAPEVTDREILAISYDSRGRVAAINSYGLENGVVINLNTRETVTGGRTLGFFEQMLGNVGNFSAESFI